MFKNILFSSLFILISFISWNQNSYAKTWENCKVPADSIIAAINQGDTITMDGCEIEGTLALRGSPQNPFIIKNPITLFGCVFDDSVFFSCCTFLCKTDFTFATFQKPAIFSGVSFKNNSIFGGCQFYDNVFFWICRFNMVASVVASSFHKIASFRADTFLTTANFSQCTFLGNATFIDLYHHGNVNYSESAFEEGVSFAATKFDGKVNLTSTQFNGITVLWKQIESRLICDDLTGFKLMQHFDDQRMLDDEDGIYLFLKNQERMEKPWYVRYPEYWFIQQTCGYGVKPLRPLATSVIIIMFFFVTYCILDIREKGLSPSIYGLDGVFWTIYNSLYYSINTFIIGAPANWYPVDEQSKTRFYFFRIFATIERTFGWILLVLFVVTLTRKFIR